MAERERLIATLSAAGLSQNEAQVYLSALSIGASSALQISRQAGLKRTTVYSIIDSLQVKGLINVEMRGFKRLFAAESPERLKTVLEQRQQQFYTALPELSALFNLKGSESLIKYYQGLAGMKSVYESLLSSVRPGDDYLVISNAEKTMSLAPEFYWDFFARRAKLPIKIRVLAQPDRYGTQLKKNQARYNQQVRFLPPGTQLTTNLVIIPAKVVMHQVTPPILVLVVENRSIVQLHRELFEMIWRSLEEKG
jgi:HTH-type transcriptional regulator, sugar sensing transcriptional regulator